MDHKFNFRCYPTISIQLLLNIFKLENKDQVIKFHYQVLKISCLKPIKIYMLERSFISKSWKTKKNEKLCLTKNIHAKLKICMGKLSLNNSWENSFKRPETNITIIITRLKAPSLA